MDDVSALSGLRQGGGDLTAPRLPVGNDDERFDVAGLAKDLLVVRDEIQSPVEPFLDVRIPRGIVLEPER
jgi:hypothetical protein